MTTIPRAAVRRYGNNLAKVTDKAGKVVRGIVSDFMAKNPDATVAEIRDYAIAAIGEVVGLYGDAASVMAMQAYDEIAASERVVTDAAAMYVGANADAIERGVRYQAGKLVDGDPAGFLDNMSELAAYHVRKAANDTMIQNVERANASGSGKARRMRYARVPTGLETCTFCTMLASRGFVYKSAESAGHADHRGCNCLIVPGIQGQTEVEGYDPQTLYRLWQDFLEIDGKAIRGDDGEILTGADEERAVRAMKAEALRARLGRDTFDAE